MSLQCNGCRCWNWLVFSPWCFVKNSFLERASEDSDGYENQCPWLLALCSPKTFMWLKRDDRKWKRKGIEVCIYPGVYLNMNDLFGYSKRFFANSHLSLVSNSAASNRSPSMNFAVVTWSVWSMSSQNTIVSIGICYWFVKVDNLCCESHSHFDRSCCCRKNSLESSHYRSIMVEYVFTIINTDGSSSTYSNRIQNFCRGNCRVFRLLQSSAG